MAEKIVGHKWEYIDPKRLPGPPDRDYFVPNFGADPDIQTTLQEVEKAEKDLNHKWIVPDKKTWGKTHDMDYFVPNFGQDPEITDT